MQRARSPRNMGPERTPRGPGPRIGLVLGAGGVLGAAWMTGALPALQERLPCAINDAQSLRSLGIRVTVPTPGPEDLAAMGVNLMDPRRRTAVLETSLRTSAAALTGRGDGQPQVA